MKLTLIRHTKVAVHPGICYGQTDILLADSYQEEKNIIREQLENLSFDHVFSSPLSRCKKLAEALFTAQSIHFDDRLKELHFGEWEEKNWDDIYQMAAGKHWMNNYLEASCPGGESYLEFHQRVASFLDQLEASFYNNVVVFTHGGVIRLVKSILENQPMNEVFSTFNPVYGGVYEFEIK